MNIDRLNINVAGIKSLGFSGDLSSLESLVGCKLPEVYVEFLNLSNGGHPEINCFELQGDTSGNNLFDVDYFYSIDNPQVENLRDVYVQWKHILGFNNFPIGRDGGGNQIYLDLESEISSVWLYLHDEDNKRLKISDNFTEFLDGLISNPDFI
ncbi:MAG: SMI1/KNR4 family protein [Alteromonadaceae bacterium]|nr:SMI1/KNR4 family protein [Alteromonadaceae bacterium]